MERIIALLSGLTPAQLALGLVAISVLMLVVEERRLSIVSLLIQYLLLGLLLGPWLYRPITWVRVGLGIVISLTLYITAHHVERTLGNPTLRVGVGAYGHTPLVSNSPVSAPFSRLMHLSMGSIFRLMVTLLGSAIAYGLWRTWPLPSVPAELNLTSYWLALAGLFIVLTSVDPLRMGLGLLTFINGFEAVYLFLEQSLVVIALLGLMDVVMALGTAVCTEAWLESWQQEEVT